MCEYSICSVGQWGGDGIGWWEEGAVLEGGVRGGGTKVEGRYSSRVAGPTVGEVIGDERLGGCWVGLVLERSAVFCAAC